MTAAPSEDRGPTARSLYIVMTILPFVFVGVRMWSRSIVLKSGPSRGPNFWWDDWLAVATLVSPSSLNGRPRNLTFKALHCRPKCFGYLLDNHWTWKTHRSSQSNEYYQRPSTTLCCLPSVRHCHNTPEILSALFLCPCFQRTRQQGSAYCTLDYSSIERRLADLCHSLIYIPVYARRQSVEARN